MRNAHRIWTITLPLLWACLGAPMAAGLGPELRTISVGNQSRHYLVETPTPNETSRRPLILLLHGHGGSAKQLLGLESNPAPFQRWRQIARENNAVLMAANGTIGPDGKRGWNDLRNVDTNPTVNDMAFLSALIDTATARLQVDANAVYVIGVSNGGHMALRVALEAPQRVAGIGAVVASMPTKFQAQTLSKPINVAIMNGTKDRIMPFKGGRMIRERGTLLSTQSSIEYWAKANGCTSKIHTQRYKNTSRRDRSHVVRTQFSDCANGSKVSLFRVQGGGHSTPSQTQRYGRGYRLLTGPQNWDIDAADEIWAVIDSGADR